MSQKTTTADPVLEPTTKPTVRRAGQDRVTVGNRQSNSHGCIQLHWDSSTGIRRPFMIIDGLAKPLVLHIDDDVDLVDALTTRLVASSFRVESAFDGQGGIELARNRPVNAIILDYDLQGGRGDAIVAKLKSDDRTKNIPIIILTAVQERGLQREMLVRGADRFMTKPFEFKELESTVRDLIYGDKEE